MFAMTYFRFEIPLDVDEATIECAFSLRAVQEYVQEHIYIYFIFI